jgi:hypothetical protein
MLVSGVGSKNEEDRPCIAAVPSFAKYIGTVWDVGMVG